MKMESNYCKVCKSYDSCEKSKNSSCDKFETDIIIRSNGRKPKNY